MNYNFDITAFQQIQDQHYQDFDNVPEINEEDVEEQTGFNAETILENGDDQLMITLCNFTCSQFEFLYSLVQQKLALNHSGGRHSRISLKSMFLITLVYLKSAMPLANMKIQFGLSMSYLSDLISETVSLCAPIIGPFFIRWIPMEQYITNNTCFRNFPQCICAVDASVQEIPRPRVDQKNFYSGKHHFHCLKMQVAVGPTGMAVDINGPFPGSVHDYKIFRDLTFTRYKINTEKDRIQRINPGFPTISALFDKGYYGVHNIIAEAKLPIRKPVGRDLSQQDIDFNNRISQDRIIVERWFGRLKRIWRIMFECLPIKTEKYNAFYLMCAALTNYHIQLHPLTNGDPVDPYHYEDI